MVASKVKSAAVKVKNAAKTNFITTSDSNDEADIYSKLGSDDKNTQLLEQIQSRFSELAVGELEDARVSIN